MDSQKPPMAADNTSNEDTNSEEEKRIFYESLKDGMEIKGGMDELVRGHQTFHALRDTKGRPLNTSDHYLIIKAYETHVKMLDAGVPGQGNKAAFRAEEGDRVTLSYTGNGAWNDREIRIHSVDYHGYLATNFYGQGKSIEWKGIDWDSAAMFWASPTPNVYGMRTKETKVTETLPISSLQWIYTTSDGALKKGGSTSVEVQFFNVTKEWQA